MTFIFLFLFGMYGNETSYSVVPQPSMEVCEHNGTRLTTGNGGIFAPNYNQPFNRYQCVDMSKPLPDSFKWTIN